MAKTKTNPTIVRIEKLADKMGVPKSRLAAAVEVSPSRWRRLAKGAAMAGDDAERLEVLAAVLDKANNSPAPPHPNVEYVPTIPFSVPRVSDAELAYRAEHAGILWQKTLCQIVGIGDRTWRRVKNGPGKGRDSVQLPTEKRVRLFVVARAVDIIWEATRR